MISLIKNSTYTKILFGFLAFYFINISVDIADATPQHIAEDLTYNDQESIIEFIVEKVLGYENAFEEYDDIDMEDHNTNNKTSIKLDFFNNQPNLYHNNLSIKELEQFNYFKDNINLSKGFQKLETPPPQV